MLIGVKRVPLMLLLLVFIVPGLVAAQTYDDEWDWNDRGYGLSSEARAYMDGLGDAPIAVLSIPVLLGIELDDLTKNFGDPRGDGTRTHEGLDMIAQEGTPVASPTDAVVVRTGDGSGSGLFVRTVNPGGESFVYMHLAAIANGIMEGSIVQRGDILGFVGNTGNASGGGAHLHFEIRNNGPQDPYPRLGSVFTLEEKMRGAAEALSLGGSVYAENWARQFSNEFKEAQARGIVVPPTILSYLSVNTPADPPSPPLSSGTNATSEIVFNETNLRIVELQRFLIGAVSGEASVRLSRAGATGYFGSITQAALIEYQRAAGLSVSGVVDDETYTHIFELADEGDFSGVSEITETASTTPASFTFTRDLEIGMKGEDVRALQVMLNKKGFVVAETGDGSVGNETMYFGALTRSAVSRYQIAHTITPTLGYFGPKTRGSLLVES